VGAGIGGPGNHEWLGKTGFVQVLDEITAAAVASAGISSDDLTAARYGVAGYDCSEDRPLVCEVIESLPFSVPYEAMNDAGPGLLAGSSNGWGVSVTAGTGVNARGRDPHGRQAVMTSNGFTYGEVGGGSDFVHRAVQDISRAW